MRNKNWLYIGGIKIRNDYIEYIMRLGKIYKNKSQYCFRVISDLGEYSSTDVCCFNTKKTARNKQAELQLAVDGKVMPNKGQGPGKPINKERKDEKE